MKEEIYNILNHYWGYKSFRLNQEEIILSVLNKSDTLALMPTGGGKSLCFQVPALAMDGLCIVVTPLIALMKDQVEKLTSLNIKASAIYTGLKYREIDRILENCLYGNTRFLYLSPERLQTDHFRYFAENAKVNLITVDEAHCISEWGYDFRPSYLKIAGVREYFPGVPLLALTATATKQVADDIIVKLKFSGYKIFRNSFDRKNLIYGIAHDEAKYLKLVEIINNIKGSGIIYVSTRKTAKELSDFLNHQHIASDFYHGGLENDDRTNKQKKWMNDQIRIMVSTNAFGMGIDKPDVRMVIHFNLPESMEAYYQEAGRAGRDFKKSYAIILANNNDRDDLIKRSLENIPDNREIKKVYRALGNFFQLPEGSGENITFDFDIREFCKKFNLDTLKTYNTLKILESQELIRTTENFFLPSRLLINYSHTELYEFQLSNPTFEPLIKTLLRSYEGLYDIYTRIDENEIAKRLDVSVELVISQLNFLSGQGIFDYIPQKTKPQLVFISNRTDENHLPVDYKSIMERKVIHENKIREIIRYAFEYNGCRTKFILNYFGEDNDTHCGHCDYCVRKSRNEISQDIFQNISDKIIDLLKISPLDISEIPVKLKPVRKEKIMIVIKWMIDNNKLIFNKDSNILSLK